MSHLLDPVALLDEAAYTAACDEFDDLVLADPGAPAGHRFNELAALIDDYETRHDASDRAPRR